MPRNTPQSVINKINAAVNQVLAEPAVKARLADLGGVTIPGTPADFGKIIVGETNKWAKVIDGAGVKLD
jgi:tripartite-type tricarboxylate transporter receptor subunit TctC